VIETCALITPKDWVVSSSVDGGQIIAAFNNLWGFIILLYILD